MDCDFSIPGHCPALFFTFMKKVVYFLWVLCYNVSVSQTNYNMKNITQDEFINLLSSAYAVVVNNEYMQYLGCDNEDRLFISDRHMEDVTYLDKIEGAIEITDDDTIFFTVDGEQMILHLLDVRQIS